MIKATLLIARETFLLLKRDKVFLPALIAGCGVALIANIASDWGVEEFVKILFDVGYFGFQLVGISVAVFWGIKSITDSRSLGALEVQLAAPVSRTAWLVGKYLGLAMALVLLWLGLIATWWAFMVLNDFGPMTLPTLGAFAFMLLGWLVVAAVATLFASFTGQAVAMFSSVSLLLVGLASALVANTLSVETGETAKRLVRGVARLWDLQQFNLIEKALSPSAWPDRMVLLTRGAYGGVLIVLLISLACLVFARRDVNP